MQTPDHHQDPERTRTEIVPGAVICARIARARINGQFRLLCDTIGFDSAVAAVQAEIQSVTLERRAAGRKTGGYIG